MKQSYYLSLLCFFLCFSLSWGQLSKNYEVATPGTLSQLVGTDKAKITDLSLTGTLNSVDFETIRQMSALKNLDMLNADLVDNIFPTRALAYIKLDMITLPKSVYTIGEQAFVGATLKSLDFSKSPNLTSIGGSAFEAIKLGNNTLDFSVNQKLNTFGRNYFGQRGAFYGNNSHVILPKNMKRIPGLLFVDFKGSITLPLELETIEEQAFLRASMSNLDFSNSLNLTTIGGSAFEAIKLVNNTLDFSVNQKLNTFGRNYFGQRGAFYGNASHVILPKNLKSIPELLFADFKGSITLPLELETIGTQAFLRANMSKLDFLHSPSLTSIGGSAFEAIKLENNTLDFSTNRKLTTFLTNYFGERGSFAGNDSHVILPTNMKVIPAVSFSFFKGSVTLPSELETIGARAFRGATMTVLDFSKSPNLTTIGEQAFLEASMSKLDFSYSSNLTTVGGSAFEAIRLENNTLDFLVNHKLAVFGYNYYGQRGAFFGNNSHVILPKNLKTIPGLLFTEFKGDLTLPLELETIGEQAFLRANMSKLDFSKSPNLSTIGGSAFKGMQLGNNTLDFSANTKLTNFLTNYFGEFGVFTGCSSDVFLPSNLKYLPNVTFRSFSGSVSIPSELESLGKFVFKESTIKELSLPSTIQTIGEGAFSGCKELEKLSICAINPPQLGSNVFNGIDFSKTQLAVPKNTLTKYNQTSQWKDFTVSVETELCVAGPEIIKDPQVNAPNSYIYDVDAAKANNYGGLEIPVAKAYAMWETNEYLEGKGIPEGTLSASIYWEDVKGLVRSVSVDQNAKDSKIKVMINQAKGKGNAVVALHVGATGDPLKDPVYWSWHVWVTDDPTNGITYDNNPGSNEHLVNTFMDRNLGALSNSFLGNDWTRSAGLMYQWGRKDPFPAMVYKDGISVRINSLRFGEVTNANYLAIDGFQKERASNIISENIRESINNPFTIYTPLESEIVVNSGGKKTVPARSTWFHNNLEEFYSKNERTPNLWSDNTGGKRMPGLKFEQQTKSSFDPCPAGWRVPAYAHMFINTPSNSPWGGQNMPTILDFQNEDYETKYKEHYKGIQIYPGLGIDFSGIPNYNLGLMPLTGHYVFYGNKLVYQDQGAEIALSSSTMNMWGGITGLAIIADFLQNNSKGLYQIRTIDIEGHSGGLAAIRCVKEDFPTMEVTTTYISNDVEEYTEGLKNPNSYMLVKNVSEQEISIPVNKAFAVYNQLLTDHQWPSGKLSTNVNWTTDTQLIKEVKVNGVDENAVISVKINANKSGNAVISLHSGDKETSEDPVLWSWHIWVSNNEIQTITYTTESKFSKNYEEYLAFNTYGGNVPLTTTFMDRNLGAIEFDVSSKNSQVIDNTRGLLYQWGRKDPTPLFIPLSGGFWGEHDRIYLGTTNLKKQQYNSVVSSSLEYDNYALFSADTKVQDVLLKSVRNPFLHISRGNTYSWLPEIVPNLWGHADSKSPFDPCPEGWRVPDFSSAGVYGSPWYKEGMGLWKKNKDNLWDFDIIPQNKSLEALSGRLISNRAGTVGVVLTSEEYNLGHFPSDGGRGIEKDRPIFLDGLLIYGQNWSASMYGSSQRSLEPLAMAFGTGNDGVDPSNLVRPRTGLPIRCAKDEIRFNKELIKKSPINRLSSRNYVEVQSVEAQTTTLTESQIKITPNPTSGLFKVLLTGVTEGKLSVVNINGTVIHSKMFANSTEVDVNIQNQPSGVYMVQVQAQGQVVNKKVIKK
ncbi:leucine-rich repeat domain-containing protein [Apibacter raozihei]|uniref:leucine-rich repeat domain-containing protein n=1 Tax=Apibacter raozihei TaxID=2500547 RepID=UPI000FE2F3D6|nr:leucine-rich repeat domain-containing protein [Apibacter raozihei]